MLVCSRCGRTYSTSEPRWRSECGGYLRLTAPGIFAREALAGRVQSLWRYREALGIELDASVVTLGEGMTPLVPETLGGVDVHLKLDFLCPTGSFKDRGSAVMISKLREWKIAAIVEDSSGNAGASVAAYAARAGIAADIFVPASASAGKLAQIALYGARLQRISGSREQTTSAALEAAGRGFYASHNWSPYFVAGLKTLAYELGEQLGWSAPDWIVAPAGGGSLLLGLYEGFREMIEAGMTDRMPRLAAIQAAGCAPIYEAWRRGLEEPARIEKRPTAAEGIAVAEPVKGRDVLAAIRGSRGVAAAVGEDEIWRAVEDLARRGFYLEPTSAAAAAALEGLRREGAIRPGQRVVLVLTGSGLKATDKLIEHFRDAG